MKSQKGITLISLTIYLIVMMMVVTIVTVISGNLYNNTSGTMEEIDGISEFIKFNAFFTEDINQNGIQITNCETYYANDVENNFSKGDSYILFNNGVQYTYKKNNKAIYRNKIKICSNVDDFAFSEEIDINGVKRVNVKWPTNYAYKYASNSDDENNNEDGYDLQKNITYTLKNW